MYNPSMEDFSCYGMTPYGQVASSSETSLCFYLSSYCYIPADIHLCSYCHENLTPYKSYFIHHEEEALLFTAFLSWNEDDGDVVVVVLMVVVAVVVVMMLMIGRGGRGVVGELFLRNLMKLYLNIENIARFHNIAAFQFSVQLPPYLHILLHFVTCSWTRYLEIWVSGNSHWLLQSLWDVMPYCLLYG